MSHEQGDIPLLLEKFSREDYVKQKRVEILAPAGSLESMKAAVAAGADAVYIGGSRFGARAYADNPEEDRLLEAIDYAHLHGCRLYMTVNTLMKETELADLYAFLEPYYMRGVDAVIVQDMGAFALIRERFPDLPVHASTQMTITGVYGARLLKELGAERVVTARELSLEEIAGIHREVDVEIESFVHGALCYCYSGQCLFSSLIGGRSGNRGRCAQTCRLPYDVKRDGKTLNGKDSRYVLSLKDLCTLDLIPDMIEAGIYSMKIEGRMKSPRYTAGVVEIYRRYTNLYLERGRAGYRVEERIESAFWSCLTAEARRTDTTAAIMGKIWWYGRKNRPSAKATRSCSIIWIRILWKSSCRSRSGERLSWRRESLHCWSFSAETAACLCPVISFWRL